MDEASFVRMFEARFGPYTRIDVAILFRVIEEVCGPEMVHDFVLDSFAVETEMDGTSFVNMFEARFGPGTRYDGEILFRIIKEVYRPEMVPRMLDFILDSGAAYHMICFRYARYLRNLRAPPSPMRFEAADGNKLTATAIGDIESKYFNLKGVCVVPDLKVNLIGVPQLTDEDNVIVTMGKNSAEVFKGGERVGGAIVEGRSYKMRFLWPIEDEEPHTSPAGPGEHITSYFVNAAVSPIKDLATSLKVKEADWVSVLNAKEAVWVTSFNAKDPALLADCMTSFEDPAVLVSWVENFKEKYMICGDLFAPTAKMDESDDTGGAAGCDSMIRDGSFVADKAHLLSEGVHGTNFMKVQLNA